MFYTAIIYIPSPTLELNYLLVEYSLPATEPSIEPAIKPTAKLAG